MESIMYRDPELEASFSFSCYDFNSAHLHVFSDDEGESINDDEYIEIALEHPRPTYAHGEDDGSGDQELELRISFSFTRVPEMNRNNVNNIALSRANTVLESLGNESKTVATTSSSSSSSSSAETEPSRLTDHDKISSIKRRVRFRAVNHLLGGFLSTTRGTSSSEMDETDHESSGQMAIGNNVNKLEMLRSRKAEEKMSAKTTSNRGMMMKFLIKCRSINVRSLFASFTKHYQVIISSLQNNSTTTSASSGGHIKKKRSKETHPPPRTYQSLVKSMGTNFGWTSDKLKTSTSPSRSFVSNKNSLQIQQGGNDYNYPAGEGEAEAEDEISKVVYARESSIHAAIAHCKRSFGHSSEFSF